MASYTSIPDNISLIAPTDTEVGSLHLVSSIEQHHVCVRRQEGGLWELLRAWYLSRIHILFSLAVWYGMSYQLQDRVFAVGRGENVPPSAPGRWYQSDITTFVAILLLIARIMAGLLQTLATWRCICFLFEKESLSLPEFEFMSHFQLPAFGLMRTHPQSSTMSLAVSAILLVWPAQFMSPLATGSLTWIPSYVYDVSNQHTSSVISSPAYGYPWRWFQSQ